MTTSLPRAVLSPLIVFKGAMGLSVGLFIFTIQLVVFRAFGPTHEVPGFGRADDWLALTLAIGILCECLLEVPTGVVADLSGRKRAVVGSMWVRAVFFGCLLAVCSTSSVGWTIFWYLFAQVIFALHYTLQSGSIVAWARDELARAIGKDAAVNGLVRATAKAQVVYWITFPLGAWIAFWMWEEGYIEVAYFSGMAICVVAGLYLHFHMAEPDRHDTPVSGVLARIAAGWRIQLGAMKIFWNSKGLWSVFALAAAVTAVMYIVDLAWPIQVESQWNIDMATSPEGLALVTVFTVVSLLGNNWVVRQFEHSHTTSHGEVSPRKLVIANVIVSIAYIIPIMVLYMAEHLGMLPLWLFIVMMGLHRVALGAIRAPADGLQNYCIPDDAPERATILSIGAMFQNFVVAALVISKMSGQVATMKYLVLPCLAVLVATAWVWWQVGRKTPKPTPPPTTPTSGPVEPPAASP